MPVLLVTKLLDYHLGNRSLRLDCAVSRYKPELSQYYGTVCETVFEPAHMAGQVTIQIDFCTATILRIRCYQGTNVPDHQTPMVVGEFHESVERSLISDNPDGIQVQCGAFRIRVQREPWRIELFDLAGKSLWSTRPVDLEPLRRPEREWNPPQERWLFLQRYAYPLGFARVDQQDVVFASFDLNHDEHIYGFGESFGEFDQRGAHKRLWLQECFGNTSPAAYKQVPFYMSSRGYGLFVNTSHAVDFRVGSLDHTAISVKVEDENLFDSYLIYGPTFRDILPRYTAITGAPAVPPKWSFGLWMSRISYNSQDQVEAVAREIRAQNIPCDVIHIDTDWFTKEWECDLRFDSERFPDPAGMCERLKEQGFRVSLWQWPNLTVGSELFEEGRQFGYLAQRPDGQPKAYSGFKGDAGLIDYSNPQAVAWMRDKIQALFRLGVAAIKTDFGEGALRDARYFGVDSAAMHNLYPLLYNQTVFEETEAYWGEGQGIVWSRSAWTCSQRYPVH